MFRKTINALCTVGAVAALCAVAPGGASADIPTLWINGEAIVQDPELDRCYPLVAAIEPGDRVHNDTQYRLMGYGYLDCQNEVAYLDPWERVEAVTDVKAVAFYEV
jgi:hypothetical protein